MIELERHIEILLLSNDCVIVPDLGGFMAHHIDAHYDDEDMMFLPPQRTLGFNPQLKLNDSLLAQSYIEAYDISYPEAVRRIEGEVSELKQHLENEGYYELNDLGVLSVNEEGRLEFEPCEAGILTPELYGLSSFEMPMLKEDVRGKKEDVRGKKEENTDGEKLQALPDNSASETVTEADVEEENEGTNAITIKMSWIRNVVATAAAVLLFFLLTTPVSNDNPEVVSKSQVMLPVIAKDSNARSSEKLNQQQVKDAILHIQESEDTTSELQKSAKEAPKAEEVTGNVDTASESKAETAPEPKTETAPEPKAEEIRYCIVLASQVSQRNAEEFVTLLQKKGIHDARVYLNHNTRRVICGSFQTEAEAYKQLHHIHQMQDLEEAWVYKMKH